jgi:hypothetical protein
MAINPMVPEERRARDELREAVTIEPAQESAVDLSAGLDALRRRCRALRAALNDKERAILDRRLEASR